jgi:hypothetical protein
LDNGEGVCKAGVLQRTQQDLRLHEIFRHFIIGFIVQIIRGVKVFVTFIRKPSSGWDILGL